MGVQFECGTKNVAIIWRYLSARGGQPRGASCLSVKILKKCWSWSVLAEWSDWARPVGSGSARDREWGLNYGWENPGLIGKNQHHHHHPPITVQSSEQTSQVGTNNLFHPDRSEEWMMNVLYRGGSFRSAISPRTLRNPQKKKQQHWFWNICVIFVPSLDWTQQPWRSPSRSANWKGLIIWRSRDYSL